MEQLRKILLDYYGTAVFSGNPLAVIKLTEVEKASPQELIKLAREIGINVLDCGHFGTEQIFCENMLALLDNLPEIDIIQCGVDLNPFTAI